MGDPSAVSGSRPGLSNQRPRPCGRGAPESMPYQPDSRLLLDRVLGEGTARLGQRVRTLGSVDIPVGVDRHALARRALIDAVVAVERRDEPGDAILVDRTDPDTV